MGSRAAKPRCPISCQGDVCNPTSSWIGSCGLLSHAPPAVAVPPKVLKSVIPFSREMRAAVPSLVGNDPPEAMTEYRLASYRELVEFAGERYADGMERWFSQSQ